MDIPEHARRALELLERGGWESYVVGGCVRDRLLGREPHDWDICTAAAPEEMLRCFDGERVLETGRKHGTLTLLTPAGPLEITAFRREGAYSDHRRPDSVEFVSDLREDLARRDFTVNAMAWSPRRGLQDPFGGEADLRAGVIRCVGDADTRFREDALRILRALRFAARYGFAIESDTAAALRRNRDLLQNISAERIFSELKGILCGAAAGDMLRTYPEVFFVFLPELAPQLGFDQHMPQNHDRDVWGHTVGVVDAVPPDPILRLAALFHDGGKPETFTLDPDTGRGHFYGHPAVGAAMADRILRRLRCDNDTRERVVRLVEEHDMLSGHGEEAMASLLRRWGREDTEKLLSLRRADAEAHAPEARVRRLALWAQDCRDLETVLAEGRCLSLRELAVNGQDILSLGVASGPEVGRILSALLSEVSERKLENEKAALLRRAEELMAVGPKEETT